MLDQDENRNDGNRSKSPDKERINLGPGADVETLRDLAVSVESFKISGLNFNKLPPARKPKSSRMWSALPNVASKQGTGRSIMCDHSATQQNFM